MATCYRHPSRETGVSCSSCGRPICPDCMTPTPVGMRCPECSRDRTKVKTARTLQAANEPTATYVLIAMNVITFIGAVAAGGGVADRGGGDLLNHGALTSYQVADGEWWRLITSGFFHAGIIHIFFNMYLLYVLGQILEPSLGHVRFVALYFTALLAGSFGVILLAND